MRATNLEQITTDYYFVMEQKDIALATLGKKEQVWLMSRGSVAETLGH